jgi:hypothetical protein
MIAFYRAGQTCQEANMLQLINPDRYGEFIDDLAEMHRLRYRIFKERLGWDVQVSGDMEVDEFVRGECLGAGRARVVPGGRRPGRRPVRRLHA